MTTNDYSAYDIHRLDQAAPDAFADIDRLAADVETLDRLTNRGEAIYGAELTRDLHNACDANPFSLASWAALATIRLVQANQRLMELNTEVGTARRVREQRDAFHVEIESLRAQVAELREQVFAQKPVIEAAEKWAEMCEDGGIAPDDCRATEDALHDAVEQYRLMDLALTTARAEQPEVAR